MSGYKVVLIYRFPQNVRIWPSIGNSLGTKAVLFCWFLSWFPKMFVLTLKLDTNALWNCNGIYHLYVRYSIYSISSIVRLLVFLKGNSTICSASQETHLLLRLEVTTWIYSTHAILLPGHVPSIELYFKVDFEEILPQIVEIFEQDTLKTTGCFPVIHHSLCLLNWILFH